MVSVYRNNSFKVFIKNLKLNSSKLCIFQRAELREKWRTKKRAAPVHAAPLLQKMGSGTEKDVLNILLIHFQNMRYHLRNKSIHCYWANKNWQLFLQLQKFPGFTTFHISQRCFHISCCCYYFTIYFSSRVQNLVPALSVEKKGFVLKR